MEIIRKIINDWDPVGFFPMAPKDEYVIEIKKIYEFVSANQNLKVQTLAETINGIFVKSFVADVYDQNMEQCMLIAEKILKKEV